MNDKPVFGLDLHKDYSVIRSREAQLGLGPPVRVVHKNVTLTYSTRMVSPHLCCKQCANYKNAVAWLQAPVLARQ